ncbi:MAG: hypothetical protein ILO53_06825 [Clostridia bacterium]|nr:hypothetical protein [Clostridia bacterium]
MKRFSVVFTALLLTVLMVTSHPLQVLAETHPDYVGEVKIFFGDYSTAEAEGYTLLKDGSNPVDLNQNAGGGLGSKGDKAVYLGYKTTKNRSEAITDLALMNMKGGYDVAEYETMFDTYIKSQINPLADKFIAMITEYRQNISRSNPNSMHAYYSRNILNKFIDDDPGKGLGQLFLNETKYEMGDAAYNALSDSQKKGVADLITILAQSNGKATLTIANLLARACDTNDTTWIERFRKITYDALVEQTGLTPTDAKKQLAKLYDDDARQILDMWDTFAKELSEYDSAVEKAEGADLEAARLELENQAKVIRTLKKLEANDDRIRKYVRAYEEYMAEYIETMTAIQTVCVYEYLENEEYGDGTMLDFFLRPSDDVDTDEIYPLVASLTPGQQAGLSFVSIKELVSMTIIDNEEYENAEYNFIDEVSIYDGVDRGIYEPGGVALTSDARRAGVTEEMEERSMFSTWTISMMTVTGIATVALAVSAAGWIENAVKVSQIEAKIAATPMTYGASDTFLMIDGEQVFQAEELSSEEIALKFNSGLDRFTAASKLCRGLTIGLGIAVIILAGVTTYMTWQDMKAYYNVEFSPIPHYMVDEKDIIGYNSKGEKVMLKNQSAYYKAVECNRTESDEFYKVLGNHADMNGDVGSQWLALYSVKKELMEPILASSLRVVVGKADVPAGYTTGIHMFGTDAAFNLNNPYYDWANDAPSVYVYFQTDDTAASTAGTIFTVGMYALVGGAGIALGAIITALAMKKKTKETVTA